MIKTALITGVSGQDGSYLAQFLLKKNYIVFGTSRDIGITDFSFLANLGILGQVKLLSMATHDFKSTLTTISKVQPDEIYHLAGQSSVGLSFEQPIETIESITIGALNIIEAVRFLKLPAKIYNASSSECFGDTKGLPANEEMSFNPISPYGVAKASAHWLVRNYREAYDMFAVNGILYNHESVLRAERFVTQKVVRAAYRISQGSTEKLNLGALSISRDWGWAPEYVEAMWLMLQVDQADDFIIATGEANSLQNFVVQAFNFFELEWTDHVNYDEELMRPNEIVWSQGNPDKAKKILGWQANKKMNHVVNILCSAL